MQLTSTSAIVAATYFASTGHASVIARQAGVSSSTSSAFTKPTQVSATAPASGNDSAFDLSQHYCRLWRHSSVLADGKIYVDGGNTWVPTASDGTYNNTSNKGYNQGMNSVLLEINLSSNFSNKDTTPYTSVAKPDYVPNGLIEGTLWYSPKSRNIYQVGGWFSFNNQKSPIFVQTTDIPDPSIWQYGIDTRNWSQANFTKKGNLFHRPGAAAYCDAPTLDRSYAFEGFVQQRSERATTNLTQNSDEIFVEGMLELDTSSSSQTVLRNITAPQYMPPRMNGALVHLPIGDKGVIVAVGGQAPTTGLPFGVVVPNANAQATEINNTYVDLYDVQTGYWFQQQTFGVPNIPSGRGDICAVVQSAADGSSYNIIIVDGLTNYANPQTVSEVWALSIPTFTWVQLWNGTGSGRWGHTCHLAGENIVVVGGMETKSAGGNVDTCDAHMPANIFSIPVSNYTGVFDAAGASRQAPVPAAVVKTIGGTSQGGAILTQPKVWNDVYLQYIFNPSLKRPSYTPTYQLIDITGTPTPIGTSGPTITASTTDAPASSSSSNGAIAGGVVGGVAAVAIIVGALLFWRRKRRSAAAAPTSPTTPAGMSEMYVDPGTYNNDMKDNVKASVHEALPKYAPQEMPSPPTRYSDEMVPHRAVSPPVELPSRMYSDASRTGRNSRLSGVGSLADTMVGDGAEPHVPYTLRE